MLERTYYPRLQLPDTWKPEDLDRILGGRFGVQGGVATRRSQTYYDTFEWNLWFGDRRLFVENHHLCLCEVRRDGSERALSVCPVPAGGWRFAADVDSPCMRETLAPLLKLRAARPVAELAAVVRAFSLLDEHGKIVFRFDVARWLLPGKARKAFCLLLQPLPLRGYDAEASAALALLREAGAQATPLDPLAAFFGYTGRAPEPYSLRPVFGLQPDMPAHEACRLISRRMLAIARANEAGVIDDIDTEFLHDYRICIRKVRSVLSLIKGVYPVARTNTLKSRLRTLARETNHLRDLDVYLLARADYRYMLPSGLHPGLTPLLDYYAAARAAEFARLRRVMTSAGYQRRMASLDGRFTDTGRNSAGPGGMMPIGTLVATRIRKAYRNIRRSGRALSDASPDTEVHALRIRCKKLRYLLEFFRELYDPERVDGIVAVLKKLQTRLGDFNDYAVQQEALLRVADDAALAGAEPQRAIGGLVTALHARQREARADIAAVLARFSDPVMAEMVASLVPTGNGVES